MNADRFTIKSQEALQAAISLAAARKHSQVAPEHLLAVLLEQPEGMTLPVLRKLGVAPDAIRARLNTVLDGLPTLSTEAEPTTAPELMQILRAAEHPQSGVPVVTSPAVRCADAGELVVADPGDVAALADALRRASGADVTAAQRSLQERAAANAAVARAALAGLGA